MNNLNSLKKIFIASPGDVKQERTCVNEVVNEVNSIVGDMFKTNYEVIKWETHSTSGMGRPQEVINQELKIEKCDLFIGIIWSRFGTPTGGKRDDNTLYESGTQEEFEIAYNSWIKTGKPKILFFRSLKNVPTKELDTEQLLKVTEFFREFSHDKSHPGLLKEYSSVKELEKNLRAALIKYASDSYSQINNDHETANFMLPAGLRKNGFDNIYIPEFNHLRNADKSESIKRTKDIHLVAHSGSSFIAQYGHRFRNLVEEKLQNGYTFKAILTNPWSESGFFISLGEIASDDYKRFHTKLGLDNKIYIDPIKVIENANWYQIKFLDSLNGFKIMSRKYSDSIQLRFTRFEIPSSILLTDNECYYEPYLPVNLAERHEKGMLTFEVRALKESHLYLHSKEYFNFLWELSDDLNFYQENISFYKEQLTNKLNISLED